MLPQYERLGDSGSGVADQTGRSAIRIRFGKLAVITVMFPVLGFLFCVVWSLLYNFDQANSTHCLVYNFLPSLSAAIGNYQPQRFVWQFSVLVHAPPRYAIAFLYKNFHVGLLRKRRKELAYLACILNITELSSLVGLTMWTSIDNYEVHKFCFTTFVIASMSYMIILIIINRATRELDILSASEKKSIKYKKRLFVANLCSILLAVYFFIRHNTYCERGVYSLFALSEYVYVYSNIGFHMTAYWDFISANLYFDWRNGIHFSSI
ncbi:post-GPI attachment to proteins factor 2-like [Topomyia yanbarensis]|uniref:post-GPI attachment to proteins factor 2-like n=1 Tax=Topomyia yanbarensis TaxID=2498891 RepID=UPI00273C3A44|nr:post-GPI attachment to proteins factor 2-like [Topomyia yanbarensis]